MIMVNKDLEDIPFSLLDRRTTTRRDTCIRDGKYHQDKKFDQRYKQIDIKEKLEQLYHNKCAFCEQEVMRCIDNNLQDFSTTIEHYRPKSIYYWLAFSWDNLLLCCHRCNQNKGIKFEIIKDTRVAHNNTFANNTHTSTQNYNTLEEPKMVHPELENVVSDLKFTKYGEISSRDNRVKYTIDTYEIDRDDLNEKRKRVIDQFIKKVESYTVKNQPIDNILKELLADIKSKDKNFIALRYWILRNYKSLVNMTI